jgi:DedD protein
MEKVIGQRVLGGVVLVAAAILFLPMVLEGAGVAALQPPEIPAKPAVPTANDLAPALQDQAAELETSIADSHGEPTFYPVQPTTQAAPETTEDVPERFRLAGENEKANTPTVAKPAAPAPVKVAPTVAATTKPVEAKVAAAPAVETKAAPVSKPEAKPVVKTEAKSDPKPAIKAEVKAEPKPVAKLEAKPAGPGFPSAWVVQVASLSSKASADDLVARLRKNGFRASAAEQGGVFKVSVGPELDRGIAESLKQRLSADAELKLNGFIVPYRP